MTVELKMKHFYMKMYYHANNTRKLVLLTV